MDKIMLIVPSHIEAIAKDFWNKARRSKLGPPYDISGAISFLLPIDIITLSELTLGKINEWLVNNGITLPIRVNDRHLHGFILIKKGIGIIFVNGTDSEEERSFTLAHEASHFILDYKAPRDKAIEKIGNGVENVLDGLRQPTLDEQISSIISGVSVKAFTHLLEKEGDGSFENIKVFDAENNADALAIELLAPYNEVIKATLGGRSKMAFDLFVRDCVDLLTSKYRLPAPIAKQYAKRIAYFVTGGASIMNKLGF
ncbi:MAG TPA: ImmA/IrrE family metallo-endopeptidase [Candidatus Babeliaceae bacterium]|nr:ImmA/IrrE family metallo-endopeptidase [Candidatus Babeliaceae bacterium]